MNVLFEEDGAFKTGVIVADNDSSLQVDSSSGKRLKLKAAQVLLRFATPEAGALLEQAQALSDEIEADFLWEVCGDDEFTFHDLAAEYYGHAPAASEATAVLLRLHGAPIYFHRKGKGRFRKAPPEILQAALAGLEKKRLAALAIERMAADLQAGRLPDEFVPLRAELLYRPDRNKAETKALEAACAATGESAVQLLARCGAIPDTHEYHYGRFLFEHFPRGTAHGSYAPPLHPSALPRADVAAFSIDDAHTTEIDDAFSLHARAGGGWRVGIHIAAPGLGIAPDSDLGRIARQRLSTVYMPGRKITMLPEEVVERYTLAAGSTVPSLSLYLDVASDVRIEASETRIEAVPIVANLRHHDIEPLFNAQTLAEGLGDFPFAGELKTLWELACVLAAGRGAAGQQNRQDFAFHIDWSRASDWGPGWVSIEERPRGSPLDLLVAELMIHANQHWGARLRNAGVAAIYRAQTVGKTRMTTVAAPHEGLGVDCYAWSSSPLRRFVDLLNQWQLIAHLQGVAPPYTAKSAELLAALRDFELTYAAYADFQRAMEQYWCLRWLLQEGVPAMTARVLKENLVRLERLPLTLRVPSLPELARGVRVRLTFDRIDLLANEIGARFAETLADAPAEVQDDAVEELPGDAPVTAAEDSPELPADLPSVAVLAEGVQPPRAE